MFQSTMLRPSLEFLNFFIVLAIPRPGSIYFTRCDRNAHKCNIFSRKTNEACSFRYRWMFIVWFHGRARDMENSLFKMKISAFSLMHTDSKVMYSKCREQNKKAKKKVFQIYSLYGFYPPLLLFINVIRLIVNSV